MATSRVRVDSINEGASSLVRSYSINEGPPHGSARTQLTRGHPTGPHGSGPVSKNSRILLAHESVLAYKVLENLTCRISFLL